MAIGQSLTVLVPRPVREDDVDVPQHRGDLVDQALEELLELVARWLRPYDQGGLPDGPARRQFQRLWDVTSRALARRRARR